MPPTTSARLLTAVDLFCGAGGLSLGLQRAGWSTVYALDHDESAIESYSAYLGHSAIRQSIDDDLDLPQSDLIVGGPPCQGFSSAGPRRKGDERNSLVRVFSEIVRRKKPSAFVFENVEGFLTAEGGRRVLELLEPLADAGYCIRLRKVNAANYGTGQHRKRVLAIGGLRWDPGFPEPSHRAMGAPGADLVRGDLPFCPSVLEALQGLPMPTDEPPGEPSLHFAKPLDLEERERLAALKPGQTMRDLPSEFWHNSYTRRANRRVKDGTPTERRGGAPAGVRRLRPNEPSKAITGGARSEFVHPTQDRYLTLRECARLQSFPDDFRFHGSRASQALQIGNAVPPLLAETVGRHLAEAFSLFRQEAPPGIREFIPTLSNGVSPALAHTLRLVSGTFEGVSLDPMQRSLWD